MGFMTALPADTERHLSRPPEPASVLGANGAR